MNSEIEQKQAWVYREEGEPTKSLSINYGLLYRYETDESWDSAINILVDISLSWSVLGRQTDEKLHFQAALQALEYAEFIAQEHNIRLRTDYKFHLGRALEDVNEYSRAVDVLEDYLKSERKNLPITQIAEVESRLGHALVKSGDEENGIRLLRKSISILEQAPEEISSQGKDLTSIKRTGAKIKLASVIKDDIEAQRLAEEALTEAESKGLGARQQQAEILLQSLQG